MASYITKQTKPNRERVEAKLDRELITQLERYCEYLDSDRDYVITQALAIAFRKDKGFREWLLSHPRPLSGSHGEPSTATPKIKG